ncbi:tetraspanin-19-like [Aristolochia californica]|uniref:tetraspanin-19-like n=1 Tax=Aristolochia californica TaxID=171875 RepID=UPI0035D73F43
MHAGCSRVSSGRREKIKIQDDIQETLQKLVMGFHLRSRLNLNMVTCTRCCLSILTKSVNVVLTCCGIVMILYSLWLLKRWKAGVADLEAIAMLSKPWFIYTFLGVGIILCLSSLFGQMVSKHNSHTALSIYIVAICSTVILQGVLIVVIFFKTNWKAMLPDYIFAGDTNFKNFLSFHVKICRLIGVTMLLAQVNVVVLTIVVWVVGPVPEKYSSNPNLSDLGHSFLVGLDSSESNSYHQCQ